MQAQASQQQAPAARLSPEQEREFQLWQSVARPAAGSDARGQWYALRYGAQGAAVAGSVPTPSSIRQQPRIAQQRRDAAVADAASESAGDFTPRAPMTPSEYGYHPDRDAGGGSSGDMGGE